MKQHNAPVPTAGRQMNLMFETRGVDGMNEAEQAKAKIALAHILMQAAGLVLEELGDERS